MIGALLWISIGVALGTLLPSKVQEWVKGKALGVFAGVGKNLKSQFARSSARGGGDQIARFAGFSAYNQPNGVVTKSARALSHLASFLWRFKFVILALVFFVLVVSWSRSCAPGGGVFGKSRDRLELENELAEAEIETKQIELQRNERIGEIARDHAVRRTQIRLESERGRDEIARATPDVETPIDAELVSAWRGYLDGLCLYPRADGSFAHSCGPGA